MRVFATTLWWYRSHSSFKNFQESLLHTFARYITSNGWVFGFTRYFINLIDINNGRLCFFVIIISSLNQFEQDVLYILTYITRFC
ncbi:hypothetical protein D3C76_1306350 [compost metagenome]